MSLICEVGKTQLVKYGEVTCGDSVEIVRNAEGTVVVLSDGLGSGVKANILSNLTTKIISKMVINRVPLEDIVETIVGTLPVCSVRNVAYSTFSILKIARDGQVDIIDFDGLPPIKISRGFVDVIERTSREVAGKKINEAHIQLKEDDYLLITSDGVTEAGLGLTLPLGLQTSGLVKALKENCRLNTSAQDLVNQVIDICMSYYINEPGDDTTAVAVHMRQAHECVIMTGVPCDMKDDARIVEDFLNVKGRKIICGGTTAQVFARETNREIEPVNSDSSGPIPPISKIKGVELVTEGIITMDHVTKLIEENDLEEKEEKNGATMLLDQLLYADKITIFFGTQLNKAYEKIKPGIHLRDVLIDKLTSQLKALGKDVTVYRY